MIDEFRLIEGPRWPVDSESVHLLVADWVIEHLRDVDGFFAECRRVLAPAGYVCLRTANALSYVGLAARLIPNRHQATVLAMVQENRAPKDVFPTLYRCNTRRKLSARLRAHGFDAYVYSHDAEPSYLAFSKFAYRLGVVHQRLVSRLLGATLLGFGRKLNG